MPGPPFLPWLMTLCWGALQGAPIDGTWELARIFRSGPTAASHPVSIDSTVYLRLTLKTMPGDWIGGRLYRRHYGKEERAKNEAGPPRPARGFNIRAEPGFPPAPKNPPPPRGGGRPPPRPPPPLPPPPHPPP